MVSNASEFYFRANASSSARFRTIQKKLETLFLSLQIRQKMTKKRRKKRQEKKKSNALKIEIKRLHETKKSNNYVCFFSSKYKNLLHFGAEEIIKLHSRPWFSTQTRSSIYNFYLRNISIPSPVTYIKILNYNYIYLNMLVTSVEKPQMKKTQLLRISLLLGFCHLQKEGHLILRLQSFQFE